MFSALLFTDHFAGLEIFFDPPYNIVRWALSSLLNVGGTGAGKRLVQGRTVFMGVTSAMYL